MLSDIPKPHEDSVVESTTLEDPMHPIMHVLRWREDNAFQVWIEKQAMFLKGKARDLSPHLALSVGACCFEVAQPSYAISDLNIRRQLALISMKD